MRDLERKLEKLEQRYNDVDSITKSKLIHEIINLDDLGYAEKLGLIFSLGLVSGEEFAGVLLKKFGESKDNSGS
jgi:hypothetical protein